MSKTIRPSEIRGIWLPLLIPWDSQWRLDERTCDANMERLIASGADGLFTLDTSSEFYTMEYDDWRSIAHRFVKRCRAANVRFPIGLGWLGRTRRGGSRAADAAGPPSRTQGQDARPPS